MESLLNKELVQLKQKLEILQSTFIFLAQTKQKPDFQQRIVDQIETDVGTQVSSITKITGVLK